MQIWMSIARNRPIKITLTKFTSQFVVQWNISTSQSISVKCNIHVSFTINLSVSNFTIIEYMNRCVLYQFDSRTYCAFQEIYFNWNDSRQVKKARLEI